MSNKEKFIHKASDGISLEGAIFDPSTNAKGTIIFTPGWNADCEMYEEVLRPLAEEYRVIAHNLRGHLGSKGRVNEHYSVSDIVELEKEFGQGNNILLTHSLGTYSLKAAKDINPESIILMTPFINSSYLSNFNRKGAEFLESQKDKKWLKNIDTIFEKLPMHKLHVNANRPLDTTAMITEIDTSENYVGDIPLLYFFADNDNILGINAKKNINDKERIYQYHQAIEKFGSNVDDASHLVRGLNHCFNYHGYVPFLKDERGKQQQKVRILDKMCAFIETQHK